MGLNVFGPRVLSRGGQRGLGGATLAQLGTRWLTEDLCEGTLIHVIADRVAVANFVNHRNPTVTAGHSYLAKAPSGSAGGATHALRL